MNHFVKHILLVALVVFGATGAWAQNTPQRQSDNTWKFNMPSGDRMLNVKYKTLYILTLAKTGEGTLEMVSYNSEAQPIVNPDGSYSMLPGSTVTLRATPAKNHYVKRWSNSIDPSLPDVNSNVAVDTTFTLNDTMTITAEFEAKPIISLTKNEDWGSLVFDFDTPSVEPYFIYPTRQITVLAGQEGENTNGDQTYKALFDGIKVVDWLQWFSQGSTDRLSDAVIWKTAEPIEMTSYILTTATDASDHPEYNWKSWTLYGGNFDNDDSAIAALNTDVGWMVIHNVMNDTVLKAVNTTDFTYTFENTTAYQYYRLVIDSTQSSVYGPQKMSEMTVRYSNPAYIFPSGLIREFGNSYIADYGTTVKVTASANEHYYVDNWSNGATIDDILATSQTVTITQDTNIMVNFQSYPILTLAAIGDGIVVLGDNNATIANNTLALLDNPDGGYYVKPGIEVKVAATASENHHIASWSNNINIIDPNYSIQTLPVPQDMTLSATFVQDFTLNYGADGPGRVELSDICNTYTNNQITIVDVDQDGIDVDQGDIPAGSGKWRYLFNEGRYSYKYSETEAADDWLLAESVELIAGEVYTFSFLSKVSVSSFPERIEARISTDNLNISQGTVVISDTVLTNTDWATISGTFVPETDGYYHFGVHAISDANMAELSVKDITYCRPHGLVENPAGGYFVKPGALVSLKAIPDDNYQLDRWSNGTPVNDKGTQTFTVSEDITVTAFFSYAKYTLTLEKYSDYGTIELLNVNNLPSSQITVLAGQQGFNTSSSESYGKLFDGVKDSVSNKWCSIQNNGGAYSNRDKDIVVWKTNEEVVMNAYILTTGGDTYENPGRNWKSWTIYGGSFTSDEVAAGALTTDEGWTPIHVVTNDTALPSASLKDQAYIFANNTAYKYYRLVIDDLRSTDDNIQQMAEMTIGIKNSNLPDYVFATDVENQYYVNKGTVVRVMASTYDDLHFVSGWENENHNDLSNDATYNKYAETNPDKFPAASLLKITMTGDTTAKVFFGINDYVVSVRVPDGQSGRGTVQIAYTDVNGQNQTTTAGSSTQVTALGGTTTTVTATPATGHHFVSWNDNETDNTRTTDTAGDYVANFAPDIHMLTLATNNDNGTIGILNADYLPSSQITVLAGREGLDTKQAEDYFNLFDGNKSDTSNKWCSIKNNAGAYSNRAKDIVVWKTNDQVIMTSYILTTGGDTHENPGRNWKSWTIYGGSFTSDNAAAGAVTNDERWTPIHVVINDNALPAASLTDQTYFFGNDSAYKYYRLVIDSIHSTDDNIQQMAEMTIGIKSLNLPSNVTETGVENQYYVEYGTDVAVIAKAKENSFVESWSNGAPVDNPAIAVQKLTITTDSTLTANFEKASPELAWRYKHQPMPAAGLTAYLGFEDDTIAGISAYASEDFLRAFAEDDDLLIVGSTNLDVISFDNDGFPVVNGVGTTYLYMLHDGSLFAYDSVAFPFTILAPATLTLASNNEQMGTVALDPSCAKPDSVKATTAGNVYKVIPGTEVTVKATATDGHHLDSWSNGAAVNVEGTQTLTITQDSTLTALFAETPSLSPAELSWSADEFTGYTMIDFNNYKPTLNNPHDVSVRYGLVEDETNVKVNPETGYITNRFNVPRMYNSGSYHVYAVHEPDQTYDYDSVVYALTVDWAAIVSILQNVEEGGNTAFLNPVDDLTHAYAYSSNSNVKVAYVAPGASFTATANANEGYHFSKWQTGNNIDGFTDYAITDTIVYTAPTEITSMYYTGLRVVFDTNTYALNVLSNDIFLGTVSGSNPEAKHFLSYEISATPNTGSHFVQWNDGVTSSSRTVILTRDTTFTAIFAPDTFTITYMDGTTELNVDTFCYRQPITEYSTSKEGYTFYGWSPAVPHLMPAKNLIVYAQWNLVCDSLQDVDGNKYPSVKIGNRCWMTANLKTTHYADGRPITNIYEYQSAMYPNVTENVNIHGRLYNWYDAIDTATLTVSTRVQGVCPDGWHLPNAEDVAVLNAIPAAELRSTTGWIGCDHNTNSTGFTAYPSGRFSSSLARYEGMGTETSWWSTIDPDPSTVIKPSEVVTAKSLCSSYFCDVIYTKSYLPADAISVRCVKAGE